MRIETDADEELTALLTSLACRQIEAEQQVADLRAQVAQLVDALQNGHARIGRQIADTREGLAAQSDRIGWLEDESLNAAARTEAVREALRELEIRLIPPAPVPARWWLAVRKAGARVWRLVRHPHLAHRDAELRIVRRCGLFDAAWYLRQNPDVARTGMDPAVHYVRHGARENRRASPRFDTLTARQQLGLGRKANPLVHFYRATRAALRGNPELFDAGFYLAANPDVRASRMDPLDHFLAHGIIEGRRPSRHLTAAQVEQRLGWGGMA